MSVEQEILVTGIKVVDLLAPYAKGGKIGQCNMFGHKYYAFCNLKSSFKKKKKNQTSYRLAPQIDTAFLVGLVWFSTPVESGQTLVI